MNIPPEFDKAGDHVRHLATALITLGFLIQVYKDRAEHNAITRCGLVLLCCGVLYIIGLWVMSHWT